LLTAFLLGGGALAVEYQLGPWQSAGRMRALDPELDMTPHSYLIPALPFSMESKLSSLESLFNYLGSIPRK
ncbi:MAG TPA: hypothetical protein VN828_03570, partial [Acidobacteriaceae bacterium]|nr:hypothetical protein [Acidobacteriaceae bacterium]